MILSDLNLLQRDIVKNADGPTVVIAGPGTGKTRTLTHKVAYLISKNIDPKSILTLTFTQKAALEIKYRIQTMLYSLVHLPDITTFHAFGFDFLQSLGKNPVIISDKQRRYLIENIARDSSDTISPKELSLIISQYKSNIFSIQKVDDLTLNLIEKYNSILSENNMMDFDDLLLLTYQILKENETKRKELQKRYSYILIDEFQDTNDLQYEIIKLILNTPQNLFVIGDPHQSIYAFRGANASIFETFKKDFPNVKELYLDINYRSFANIVNASNLLFPSHNSIKHQTLKKGRVAVIKTLNEYSEADWIVKFIQEKIGGSDLNSAIDAQDEGVRFSDFAVIYRTHHIGKVIGEKLNKSGLPYQIVGEGSPYEEKHVAFVCSLLEYLYDKSNQKLLEVIKYSFLKFPIFLLQAIDQNLKSNQKSFVEVLEDIVTDKKLSSKDQKMLKNFLEKLKKTLAISSDIPLTHYITEVLNIWDIPKDIESIKFFMSCVVQFDAYPNGLKHFIEYLEDLKSHEFFDLYNDKITLLTMHAAKGLEFRYVVICGFEEGLIPHERSVKSEDGVEEEKRLLYVAMTRAKEELYLLYAQKRGNQNREVSCFKKLLTSVVEEIEDPNSSYIIKRQQKNKLKKSQMSLF